MRADLRKTASLGEVVAAAFDKAADYSTNPKTSVAIGHPGCRAHAAHPAGTNDVRTLAVVHRRGAVMTAPAAATARTSGEPPRR